MKEGNAKAFGLVFVTVLLGLASAAILKKASMEQHLTIGAVLLAGMAAAFVNGLRFVIWGIVHRQYPISISYPLSSTFFPLILAMGMFYGETVTLYQGLAVIMISIGVGILTFEGDS